MLAKQIINLDIQLIALTTNQFPLHQPSLHSPAPQSPAPHHLAPQPIQLNHMARILTERPRHILNLYWQPGQPIGAPVNNFRQI